jgi:hypothetical protein
VEEYEKGYGKGPYGTREVSLCRLDFLISKARVADFAGKYKFHVDIYIYIYIYFHDFSLIFSTVFVSIFRFFLPSWLRFHPLQSHGVCPGRFVSMGLCGICCFG